MIIVNQVFSVTSLESIIFLYSPYFDLAFDYLVEEWNERDHPCYYGSVNSGVSGRHRESSLKTDRIFDDFLEFLEQEIFLGFPKFLDLVFDEPRKHLLMKDSTAVEKVRAL